jgi:DNA-binding NarL/FixJ family response regulator
MTDSGVEPLHVAIVSRREIVSRGTAALLAERPDRALPVRLASIDDWRPGLDVALYDLDLLRLVGESHLTQVVARAGGRVVGLAAGADSPLAARAMVLGVAGCLALDAGATDLVRAITAAGAGERVDGRVPAHGLLTPQERAIVGFIFAGLSNSQIADKLFISANTLKSHIRSAYRKMGVQSRPQAVAWCARHGLTSLDEPAS